MRSVPVAENMVMDAVLRMDLFSLLELVAQKEVLWVHISPFHNMSIDFGISRRDLSKEQLLYTKTNQI